MPPNLPLLAIIISIGFSALATAAEKPSDKQAHLDAMSRGESHYVAKCIMCHQANGQGAPPLYPPLAKSNWLSPHRKRTINVANRQRAIRVLCEGLSGPIEVNGRAFENSMPAQMLDDQQVADVLTYVSNSWGNKAVPYSVPEVAAARATSRFKTFDALVEAASYQPLPAAPAGWKLREIVQLPEFCLALTGDGTKKAVYLLSTTGTVFRLDLETNTLLPILKSIDYIDRTRGESGALGFTLGKDGRLWIVTNQFRREGVPVYTNEVVIWRSDEAIADQPVKLRPWFKTSYPQGSGAFNHGVSHIDFGPDGMLYVNSGSRTDGGGVTRVPHYAAVREVDLTASIWRLDPNASEPKIEIFARGLRNAFGFAWDSSANLFTVSNGPDVSAPEEMDFVEFGKHYGFPYQFSNWPIKPKFPYRDTPAPPAGLQFTLPVVNLGPDGGGSREKPMSTFDPHSSPAGMMWCGEDFPEPLRNGFLITRFGNLLGDAACPDDVGFDLLSAHMEKTAEGNWAARMTRVLAPLGRPVDVHSVGKGAILILEYTRPTNFKEKLGNMPGRILELSPE